jgi:hypothetical protein
LLVTADVSVAVELLIGVGAGTILLFSSAEAAGV